MKYYLAPLEGVTGHIYRRTLRDFFCMPDKCFTPFIAPNQNRCMNNREEKDILPENNLGINLVPQILTNKSEDFLRTCKELQEFGYGEVNLNLGCPSGTVVSKKRGSGFLSVPEQLDDFLEAIFEKTPVKISVKTRLGIEDPEEFYRILEIYNKYPIHELIIHPRVQKDFYKNKPRMEIFTEATKISCHNICYNGDVFTIQDLERLEQQFPNIEAVMIGRGVITNPGFFNLVKGQDNVLTKERLKGFHDKLVEEYEAELFGEKSVLFKMKELWFYMIRIFCDSEKEAKQIRKVQKLSEYKGIVEKLFSTKELYLAKELFF